MFQLFIFMFNSLSKYNTNRCKCRQAAFACLGVPGNYSNSSWRMGPVGKLSHHFCHPWWRCKRNDEDVRLDKIYQQDNGGRAQGHQVKQAMFLRYFWSTEQCHSGQRILLDILEGSSSQTASPVVDCGSFWLQCFSVCHFVKVELRWLILPLKNIQHLCLSGFLCVTFELHIHHRGSSISYRWFSP